VPKSNRGAALEAPLGVSGIRIAPSHETPSLAVRTARPDRPRHPAPLDLIGHATHRFDSALRLDPTIVRTILELELPTAITALERMP
jgi:hypothetical protein